MTECRHCGRVLVNYVNEDKDWYVIGEDDAWMHVPCQDKERTWENSNNE